MAVTNYTSLLGLALPTTGDLYGTWGDVANASITTLLDSAIAGTTTLSTDADVTLSTANGATNEARQAILLCTGARTAVRNITAPAHSKAYYVINSTTGGYNVVFRGVGPTVGVSIPAGIKAIIVWNGSDFVKVASSSIDIASEVSGILPPANGGTGASTLTGLLVGNGVGAFTAVTAPTGTVVGTTDTQTLTNKRVTPRVDTIASSATITPTSDANDQYSVTTLATPATFAAPSGTPTNGQKLIIRYKDDGTARALTWTTTSGAYRAIGVVLPTTTVPNKTTYVGCIYNSAATYWDVVAVNTEL